jgi:threonylcarbamoyladenosine tRNA methylthiotransferase MtaB
VDKRTKLERSARQQTACDALRNTFLRQMVGSTQEVLFETPKHGLQLGYTRNYTPVAVASPDCLTGQIRQVKIAGTDGDGCIGELV